MLAILFAATIVAPVAAQSAEPDLRLFFEATSPDRRTQNDALKAIEKQWKNGYTIMLVELARFLPSGKGGGDDRRIQGSETLVDVEAQGGGGGGDPLDEGGSRFASRRDPRVQAREKVVGFLEDRTRQKFGDDWDAWMQWIWSQPYDGHAQYGVFKANAYRAIDQKFMQFFQGNALVRMDEVEWGGVPADGIPPLDHPKMIPAEDASFMDDSNIVFGFAHNGEAHAYPKRILAHHELMYDTVGGAEVTVVYCTLCGTVIPYKSEVSGRAIRFGTSGFLYRSNKLLYEPVTWTLWSSLTGEPVIGRAAGSGLHMEPLPVVTTTWGEWREANPDTMVVSLETGFQRNYDEGVAYASYFATDDLMFDVPIHDDRLANKAEVLGIRLTSETEGEPASALAVDAAFLARNPVWHRDFAGKRLVVLTSPAGANRVYEAGGTDFARLLDNGRVEDSSGTVWIIGEDVLVREDGSGAPLPRVPAFRAFWFGWYAQYPETELVTD